MWWPCRPDFLHHLHHHRCGLYFVAPRQQHQVLPTTDPTSYLNRFGVPVVAAQKLGRTRNEVTHIACAKSCALCAKKIAKPKNDELLLYGRRRNQTADAKKPLLCFILPGSHGPSYNKIPAQFEKFSPVYCFGFAKIVHKPNWITPTTILFSTDYLPCHL